MISSNRGEKCGSDTHEKQYAHRSYSVLMEETEETEWPFAFSICMFIAVWNAKKK